VAAGRWDAQFSLPALQVQDGAGASADMNVNEVLADRACEILGGRPGDAALVHPLEHVNRHQSTDDVYPTALKVAAIAGFRRLEAAAGALQDSLQRKDQELAPTASGMEFCAIAEAVGHDRWRSFKCEERLRAVNLGAADAPRDFIVLALERLGEVTGLSLTQAESLPAGAAGADAFGEASGVLKAHAATLLKISEGLRSPALPAVSAFKAGKPSPALLELASQVALRVEANDWLVTEAVSRARLQNSEFLPLLAQALLESLELLAEIDFRLAAHVDAIAAGALRCPESLRQSPPLIAALSGQRMRPADPALAR
jgi:aspartate ammonia-lyase